MRWESRVTYLTFAFAGMAAIAFVYVIANNITYKQLWQQKCKDGGGVTVVTPEGYVCINPSAIVEVD